ncbi:hypothetical protein B0H12DRAFT_1324422 [Mycena haematopus]|nr:hypothetical protein B0H12DRAFT_1324422 [Mycena haematopus]
MVVLIFVHLGFSWASAIILLTTPMLGTIGFSPHSGFIATVYDESSLDEKVMPPPSILSPMRLTDSLIVFLRRILILSVSSGVICAGNTLVEMILFLKGSEEETRPSLGLGTSIIGGTVMFRNHTEPDAAEDPISAISHHSGNPPKSSDPLWSHQRHESLQLEELPMPNKADSQHYGHSTLVELRYAEAASLPKKTARRPAKGQELGTSARFSGSASLDLDRTTFHRGTPCPAIPWRSNRIAALHLQEVAHRTCFRGRESYGAGLRFHQSCDAEDLRTRACQLADTFVRRSWLKRRVRSLAIASVTSSTTRRPALKKSADSERSGVVLERPTARPDHPGTLEGATGFPRPRLAIRGRCLSRGDG